MFMTLIIAIIFHFRTFHFFVFLRVDENQNLINFIFQIHVWFLFSHFRNIMNKIFFFSCRGFRLLIGFLNEFCFLLNFRILFYSFFFLSFKDELNIQPKFKFFFDNHETILTNILLF